MKYIVILADGMADEPIGELAGLTPMEFASTPAMDRLAKKGSVGLVQTVPRSMKPGSDVANLAVLGYDPQSNYSGRSPLEALSVRVPFNEEDVVLRCNLVTVSEEEEYSQKKILDHSSGEISTEDADILMESIRQAFNNDQIQFYTGTSYRHITVWKNGRVLDFQQPHDHLGEVIGPYLPTEPLFRSMMEKSFEVLNNHPLNQRRAAEGKNKANSLWFWGAGTKPALQNFYKKTGLKGSMISAVDLLKGIAVGTGMEVIEVEGANGSLNTNYIGKAESAVDSVLNRGNDFVYVHVEAPDEMGHQGNVNHKVQAIENIDRYVVDIICNALDASGEDYRMLILPDHPTPIRCRTHTSDPVPYLLYDSTKCQDNSLTFTERDAAKSKNFEAEGYMLLQRLIQGE